MSAGEDMPVAGGAAGQAWSPGQPSLLESECMVPCGSGEQGHLLTSQWASALDPECLGPPPAPGGGPRDQSPACWLPGADLVTCLPSGSSEFPTLLAPYVTVKGSSDQGHLPALHGS